jgi:hypothetical protein
MIDYERDHALLAGHVWRAQFGHHHVSFTAEVGEEPMLYLKRKVTPELNPKKKKRNREFLRLHRAFRATILDDIAKILGHEHFGTSTNFRAIEKWEDGVVE